MPPHGTLHDDLLEAFRWIDGHADVWRFFADGGLLRPRSLIRSETAASPRSQASKRVVSSSGRSWHVSSEPVLSRSAREAGSSRTRRSSDSRGPTTRGREQRLRLQWQSIAAGGRVLLVDDWVEVGSQAIAACALVDDCGGEFLGIAVIVDQLPALQQQSLGRFHALLRADELPEN